MEEMNWTVNEIRAKYLEFFESKGHKIEASAPMVIKDDPTLMFTNAGMNQFKDIFLGNSVPRNKRISNSQKCLRVSGKHNDLEEVGVDTYHHTMFEMLGNWSFGDYFKKEAIEWAWELLTEVYKLDKDRLYITVFEGDKDDKTEPDIEAENIWKNLLPADRILRCDKKDNFWEMGEMGPCGPCSEIHIDLRSVEDRLRLDGKTLVNEDHPEVIEIWNLVFIQFNRDSKGELSALPQQHVDTGMGLERLVMALQKKISNYDTDVFGGLISELEKISGLKYTQTDSKHDVAFRVIADHVRAVAFSIADGQLPSNTGAGYVIRRILRRAIRYGYSFLDIKTSFINTMIPRLVGDFGVHFSELSAQQQLIVAVIKEEEDSFLRTLSKGLMRLNEALNSESELTGNVAFELYDTFGFPIDLTELVAAEQGVKVDMVGFNKELVKQKNRSRNSNIITADDWIDVKPNLEQNFIGYDELVCESEVIKYRCVESKGKKMYQIVLNQVPFYPEGGGQVGDKGMLVQDETKVIVFDTKRENDLIIVFTKELNIDSLKSVLCYVNKPMRIQAQANHTATHLLHHVLRNQLGEHVEQKGSLVSSDYLRFDFSHFQKIPEETIQEIEKDVNGLIAEAIPLNEHREIDIEVAKDSGAMMLFGEKYGDKVRLIEFGDSKELCGGTHVSNTSEIRIFKITAENSVAAGIRRIEALTSEGALNLLNNKAEVLSKVETLFHNPKDVVQAAENLLSSEKALKKKMEYIEKGRAKDLKSSILSSLTNINGSQVYFGKTDVQAGLIKDILFQINAEVNDVVIGIASLGSEKLTFSLLVSETVVFSKGIKANEGIKLIAPIIKGGGGGQSFFATAGGKNIEGIDTAFSELQRWVSVSKT